MTASQPGAMIVIAGGVGPAAGVDLHRRVINHTLTNERCLRSIRLNHSNLRAGLYLA